MIVIIEVRFHTDTTEKIRGHSKNSLLIVRCNGTGVPNVQLVKENKILADQYNGKSVAERNSIDLAFKLLMEDSYQLLRHTIYSNEAELLRFRRLVTNAVLATDIVDQDLKALRNARWDEAFHRPESTSDSTQDKSILKATIVIQYLMQASDVAHTMQHWHVYRKWNEFFFLECYQAYQAGRTDVDPSINWYQGEIGFFDYYIIPLAKKLKECGVFGVSSDEYLNYALSNRNEWTEKGQQVVSEMLEKAQSNKT